MLIFCSYIFETTFMYTSNFQILFQGYVNQTETYQLPTLRNIYISSFPLHFPSYKIDAKSWIILLPEMGPWFLCKKEFKKECREAVEY